MQKFKIVFIKKFNLKIDDFIVKKVCKSYTICFITTLKYYKYFIYMQSLSIENQYFEEGV